VRARISEQTFVVEVKEDFLERQAEAWEGANEGELRTD
jgi:hypothetical protein